MLTVAKSSNKVTPVFQLFTKSEWFLTEILELTPDCLLVIDQRTGLVVYANKASEDLYGFDQDEFIGMSIHSLNVLPTDEIKKQMRRVIDKYPNSHRFEAIHTTKNNKHVPVEVVSKLITVNGRRYFLSHITNITKNIKLKRKISDLITQLSNQAYRDHLTECYNRNYLFSVLLPKKLGTKTALLILNINKFKSLNYSSGNQLGDTILIETAKLIRAAAPAGTKVIRYSGGEFLILLPRVKGDEHMVLSEILNKKIAEGIYFEDHKVTYTVSIGFAVGTPATLKEFEELINEADQKTYSYCES
ncbi:sensor domain-containing diguanylate cyclase [Dendrosporobacter sp. 1207_IL3150]|uniref:sensor domain-containing diguanylate cyclase n=1 Tax=Dendrosporobacter sp. 1207_IL3150 TaxID=3084054 RepID=UPI002FD9A20D